MGKTFRIQGTHLLPRLITVYRGSVVSFQNSSRCQPKQARELVAHFSWDESHCEERDLSPRAQEYCHGEEQSLIAGQVVGPGRRCRRRTTIVKEGL